METQSFKNNILYTRAMRQFGDLLPPDVHINSGIGRRLRISTSGMLQPTKFLYKDEEDVEIAGELKQQSCISVSFCFVPSTDMIVSA